MGHVGWYLAYLCTRACVCVCAQQQLLQCVCGEVCSGVLCNVVWGSMSVVWCVTGVTRVMWCVGVV